MVEEEYQVQEYQGVPNKGCFVSSPITSISHDRSRSACDHSESSTMTWKFWSDDQLWVDMETTLRTFEIQLMVFSKHVRICVRDFQIYGPSTWIPK